MYILAALHQLEAVVVDYDTLLLSVVLVLAAAAVAVAAAAAAQNGYEDDVDRQNYLLG